MPSIIIPDKGPEPIEIEEADYEGVIGLLQGEGRPVELVAEEEVIVAGEIPLGEAMPVQTEVEGLDPSVSFYGEPSEDTRLEQAMVTERAGMEGMGLDPATLSGSRQPGVEGGSSAR